MNNSADLLAARYKMVADQIAAKGVRDPRVLEAMRNVAREKFVPEDVRGSAFEDAPLPIGASQTISQPYIVAFMIEALGLKGGEKVLEIGTGSGYAAAVLGEIAGQVYSIERISALAKTAAETLRSLNYHTVHVIHGDGTRGWPEQAPFDGIIVSAGGPRVPESLKSQLKIGGRMVIPVGSTLNDQQLIQITRVSELYYETECIANVRFVPLLGAEGWHRANKHVNQSVCIKPADKPI